MVAWLATHTSKSAAQQLMRTTWRTIGRIIERVVDTALGGVDLLDGAVWIGIDEKSWKRGHEYLTVVTCHKTGRMIWAAPGRDKDTVKAFFDQLGEERCAKIELVSADGAEWIHDVVHKRCPRAQVCLDPFHIVQWCNNALDELRREAWNQARREGDPAASQIKQSRYALVKNGSSTRCVGDQMAVPGS